jgi:hypothetical protein
VLPKLAGTVELAPRERAALDFAEALGAGRPSVDDALMARLRSVFTDAEIVELGFAAGGSSCGAASTAPSTSRHPALGTTQCSRTSARGLRRHAERPSDGVRIPGLKSISLQ